MPPCVLSARSRAALSSFLDGSVLLAFDFDGVLAPIVPVRGAARLRARTRSLLTRLARRFPCIVVSGRQLADLSPRLTGIPIRMVFGNFGYEPASSLHPPPRIVERWMSQLERRFAGERGVVVEDKRFSVAVHYRHADDPERAHLEVREVLTKIHGARVLEGTMAMMLVPRSGPTKGSTLQRARMQLRCDRALYIGDDGTDEDAFTSGDPTCLLSIRVGAGEPTRARFRLDRQADLDRLLSAILAMSKRGSGPRAPRAARRS